MHQQAIFETIILIWVCSNERPIKNLFEKKSDDGKIGGPLRIHCKHRILLIAHYSGELFCTQQPYDKQPHIEV